MAARSDAQKHQPHLLKMIDEARFERKRGGSRSLSETQPPAYQVLTLNKAPAIRVPVLTFITGNPGSDLIYIELPGDPKTSPVRAFRDLASDEQVFTLPPSSGSPISSRDVVDRHGTTVCRVTVNRRAALLRTRWTVSRPDGTTVLTFSERVGDAFWRRTMRPFGSLRDVSGPDLSALVFVGLFYPIFAIKPRCQLIISGPDGRKHGMIQFVCTLKSPREDFSIYLTEGRTAESDILLFPAALAAIQSMR